MDNGRISRNQGGNKMKSFFIMIGQRIKKLIATILSVPFMLLLIAVYANMDSTFIFALIVGMLSKRTIEKIKGVGFWKSE